MAATFRVLPRARDNTRGREGKERWFKGRSSPSSEPFHRILLGSTVSPPAALPGLGSLSQPQGLATVAGKGKTSFFVLGLARQRMAQAGARGSAGSGRQMQGELVPWEMPGAGGFGMPRGNVLHHGFRGMMGLFAG